MYNFIIFALVFTMHYIISTVMLYYSISSAVSSDCILFLFLFSEMLLTLSSAALYPYPPCVPCLCSAPLLHTALLLYTYTFMQNIYTELTTSIYRENRF